MKKIIKALFLTLLIIINAPVSGQDQGEAIFKKTCVACHTINKGRLVGPDLANIQQRRSDDWLNKFIKSSQTVINSGDSTAVAIFEEYNKLPMPDQALSDNDVKLVLNYISSLGEQPAIDTIDASSILSDITKDDIIRGEDLFEGSVPFENGGPSCFSCHNVSNKTILPGGLLAKDLTTVFSRMNEAGINSIISNSPFPAMSTAYVNKNISEQEKKQLIAFLFFSDRNRPHEIESSFEATLFVAAILGIIILLSIFYTMWFRTKKRSVNYFYFERQS